MTKGSFSLTGKLAATGAFLAFVVMAVGTEEEPGLVIAGKEAFVEMRPPVLTPPPAAAVPQQALSVSVPSPVPPPVGHSEDPDAGETPEGQLDATGADGQVSPELGRVPLDLSKGPPSG